MQGNSSLLDLSFPAVSSRHAALLRALHARPAISRKPGLCTFRLVYSTARQVLPQKVKSSRRAQAPKGSPSVSCIVPEMLPARPSRPDSTAFGTGSPREYGADDGWSLTTRAG